MADRSPGRAGAPEPLETVTRTAGVAQGRQRGKRRLMGWPLVLAGLAVLLVLSVTATVLRADGTLEALEDQRIQTSDAEKLTLGYFANLTHGPALAGVHDGLFAEALGETDLSTQVFATGPTTIEAMNSGEVDAAFMGPNPAINSYVQSGGESITIIGGATSGGAQFVVSDDVAGEDDLAGRTFATPALGGTQDVALRVWLAERGYEVDTGSPDSVSITPMPSGQALQTFRQGQIDGFWGPQPWVTLITEEGGRVLVDEGELWPDGQYPTTVLAVRTDYLKEHPQTVEKLLDGLEDSVAHLEQMPQKDEAAMLNEAMVDAQGQGLPEQTLISALEQMQWTSDPLASTYSTLLDNGVSAGVTQEASLEGLVDVQPLNRVRERRGLEPVEAQQ
ncbi:ABC transporter substrate-binding protein [Kocuria sp. p3-SID1433]|uniref:ABC transporter substrate-binding protein n=1 Tax=unclassified Kocuria TaxID=2649579 RepID=UPI0021A6B934|nr:MULTISPECIES: ABC transporter substrate-binding protein [unclassified Kocuria]MCT1600971.1 ABC transporter substrate-binding protein [Kocuria sp. p3-SID1428]MCT2179075.1 ABC transporter substrate-binding protein [Kocuria sp. p3-SID1433]